MPLMQHQLTGVRFLLDKRYALLGDEMGTGKTLQALVACNYLLNRNKIKNAVIVVPASLIQNWREECIKFIKRYPYIYQGSNRNILKAKIAPIIITSYDTFMRDVEKFSKTIDDFALVLDEAHYIKSTQSSRAKAVKQFGANAKYRWALTGTPVSNKPHDLYSLVQFINPQLAGYKKDWYQMFVREQVTFIRTRWRGTIQKTIPIGVKEGAVPLLNQLLSKIMLRRLKKDCVDLPAKQIIYTRYDLDIKTRKFLTMTREDLQDAGYPLSKLLIRLQQVLDGVLKTEDEEGNVINVDTFPSSKMAMLDELLESRSGRVIVWFRFSESLKFIRDEWKNKYPIYDLYGELSQNQRQDNINQWRQSEDGVLFATIKAAGVGLNLTEADTAIFYSYEFSPAENNQAEDRIHRVGQTQHCTIYYLYGRETIEQAVLELLKKKRQTNRASVDGPLNNKELKEVYNNSLKLFSGRGEYERFVNNSSSL